MNAENVLEIRNAAIADRLAVYVDEPVALPARDAAGAPATSGPGASAP